MSTPWPSRHVTLHLGSAIVATAALGLVPVTVALTSGTSGALVNCELGLAATLFVLGFVWKVARWMRAAVPFCVPLTIGQHEAGPSQPRDRLGSPSSTSDLLLRVVCDVLLFRPLLRSTPSARKLGCLSGYAGFWLWSFAFLFHASLAMVGLRHLRFLLSPVPEFVTFLETADSVTDLWVPRVHATSLLLLLALGFLLGRRLVVARLRYVSLTADYFPLLLLMAIAATGVFMRHAGGADIVGLKQSLLGSFSSAQPQAGEVGTLLAVHLFLVSVLIAYFPVSKLMHMPGALMSPTLTLLNKSRERRHINVANPTVEMRHYADYEAEFRERMIEAGLPVEES